MNIKNQVSFKRLALSKANTQIVAVTAVAAFITVFCLVAAYHFMGLRSYQAKIIAADNAANSKLQADNTAKNQLVSAYNKFIKQNPNVLGVTNFNRPFIYNNATIIRDALPTVYDFPALTSSIQNLLPAKTFNIDNISGTDQSTSISNTPSSNPQPVSMPFSFTITNASYQSIQLLFNEMQLSIRPMVIDNMTISGSDSNITLAVNAHTYFMPGTQFKIGTETISR